MTVPEERLETVQRLSQLVGDVDRLKGTGRSADRIARAEKELMTVLKTYEAVIIADTKAQNKLAPPTDRNAVEQAHNQLPIPDFVKEAGDTRARSATVFDNSLLSRSTRSASEGASIFERKEVDDAEDGLFLESARAPVKPAALARGGPGKRGKAAMAAFGKVLNNPVGIEALAARTSGDGVSPDATAVSVFTTEFVDCILDNMNRLSKLVEDNGKLGDSFLAERTVAEWLEMFIVEIISAVRLYDERSPSKLG
ncbi:MAG: hypothetical protein M1825_004323 [Sarcosagium campestre]|nr:MAG: hypothetical protein M1825_004323 [Sarcosagium campestre]